MTTDVRDGARFGAALLALLGAIALATRHFPGAALLYAIAYLTLWLATKDLDRD